MTSCISFQNGIPDIESTLKPVEDPIKALEYLDDIVHAVADGDISNKSELNAFCLQLRRKYHTTVNNVQLLHLYRQQSRRGKYVYDARFEELFQSKVFRSQSGVLVIAVFTSPYPEWTEVGECDVGEGEMAKGDVGIVKKKQTFSCEYDCYYCPAEPGQPRSYLLKEPGVLRANANNFDPVRQFVDRANTYIRLGHPLDKIELLVLGGTWSSYPILYQDEFIRDIFYAANTYYEGCFRARGTVAEEIAANENALVRIIGLTLETRPDRICGAELARMRSLGVTRIQMGVQHTQERVLRRINRRCSPAAAKKALRLAKDCGFKVDVHLMPDLPQPLKEGVEPWKNGGFFKPEDIDTDFDMLAADREMFDTMIHDPDWQADQWKIYPCTVVDWTRIKSDFETGAYKPYGNQTHPTEWTPLFDLLVDVVCRVPPWVRLNRIIRDIPGTDILGGNRDVNMRQRLDREFAKRGSLCMDIRAREVKKRTDVAAEDAELVVRDYEASGGREYFLSFESPDRRVLFGFLRLRLVAEPVTEATNTFPELAGAALIRELHVYGAVKRVGEVAGAAGAQHRGMGSRLLEAAEGLALGNGWRKIAVISGVGVKSYYRRHGFEDEGLFMTKRLEPRPDSLTHSRIWLWLVFVILAILVEMVR